MIMIVQKKQRNKIGFIYLCLCLAIIGVAAYSFISTFSINVVTIIIMLFGVFMIVIFKSYLDSWSGIILSSDHILSILDKTKDYPEIKRIVINRLLSGSILTGKDEEYIFSQLKRLNKATNVKRDCKQLKSIHRNTTHYVEIPWIIEATYP